MGDGFILPARHKLDVDVYDRMGEAGIFGEDDRIELIDGDLIDMAQIGQGHEGYLNWLVEAFFLACNGRAIVSPQNSIRLDRWSAPQPDLAVLRRRADFYTTGERAGPSDVFVLVEVADSSLNFDRNVKAPLYARAGIGEYWIVDLNQRVVEVYRAPGEEGYGEMKKHYSGEKLALALAPDIVVTFDLLFGS
jgi:Uma2 family endonuclease